MTGALLSAQEVAAGAEALYLFQGSGCRVQGLKFRVVSCM